MTNVSDEYSLGLECRSEYRVSDATHVALQSQSLDALPQLETAVEHLAHGLNQDKGLTICCDIGIIAHR